jgi:T-complex protein 1 subunit theta
MGYCTEVNVQEIGGKRVLLFKNAADSKVATIVLRGSTSNQLADLERAVGEACVTSPFACFLEFKCR